MKTMQFYMVAAISAFWSLVAASYIFTVTLVEIPLSNMRSVDTVLGFVLGTIVATIINFWVGSSLGSKQKDEPNENIAS